MDGFEPGWAVLTAAGHARLIAFTVSPTEACNFSRRSRKITPASRWHCRSWSSWLGAALRVIWNAQPDGDGASNAASGSGIDFVVH
jgi:hypothetical protein